MLKHSYQDSIQLVHISSLKTGDGGGGKKRPGSETLRKNMIHIGTYVKKIIVNSKIYIKKTVSLQPLK